MDLKHSEQLELVDKGNWGHSRYEAYFDSAQQHRPTACITGVACVCFASDGKIALMNNEPLGGHIEPGEAPEDALKREVLEEGGIELTDYRYCGFYKIFQNNSAPQAFVNKYPKIGYILFFVGKEIDVCRPYGSDIGKVTHCSIDELSTNPGIKHELLKHIAYACAKNRVII